MVTEAQKKARKKYDAANTQFIGIKLNRKTDADILEYLEAHENRQGVIKDCIRLKMQFDPEYLKEPEN